MREGACVQAIHLSIPLHTHFQRHAKQVGDLVDLEGSLNNMWEGDARTTFHNAFTGDVQQMGNFYKAVKIYVDTLLAAAEKYQTTEAANVEIANTRSYH